LAIDSTAKAARIASALVSSVPDALLAVDPNGTVLSWNTGVELLFGHGEIAAIGKSVYSLAPQDGNSSGVATPFSSAIQTACQLGSTRWKTAVERNGSSTDVDMFIRRVLDAQGEIDFLTIVQKNPTRPKPALAEDPWAQRLRGLLEAASDAMIIVDGRGRVLLANHQMGKLFGYTRQELAGQAIEILVPERFRKAHPGHRSIPARFRGRSKPIDTDSFPEVVAAHLAGTAL
jgi:PAS domain S-box-containing protein